MKKRFQDFIVRNQAMLDDCRIALDSFRQSDSVDAYDLLHVGAHRAETLLSLGLTSYDKGGIDRPLLMAAVELANAWLAFDDEVLDLVAEVITGPVGPQIGIVRH